jgi:hypothetical protein
MAEMMQRLLAKMDASHKEAETDRKAYREALNEITTKTQNGSQHGVYARKNGR